MTKSIVKCVRISFEMEKDINEIIKEKFFDNFPQFIRYALKKAIQEEKNDD